MRAELAKLLLIKPDLLLLDDRQTPRSGGPNLVRKIPFIHRGAVMVHPRPRLLNRVVNRVLAIEPGKCFSPRQLRQLRVCAQKPWNSWKPQLKRQERLIEKETKIHNRSARRRQSQLVQAVSNAWKNTVITIPRTTKKIHFAFPEPPHSGKEVISLRHIKKAYGDKVIYDDLNLTVNRGDRVTLVGPNGAGKTTLAEDPRRVCLSKLGAVLGANS